MVVPTQQGVIHVFPNDQAAKETTVFLDITDRVRYSDATNEEGFLGLAFHPKYKENGEFFVYYSSAEGQTGRRSVVSRFRVSKDDPRKADPGSEERVWLGPPDPYGNHNGGCILFGPDGYLYITLGDSGAADDPLTTGQDARDFFGYKHPDEEPGRRPDTEEDGDADRVPLFEDAVTLDDPETLRRYRGEE